MAEVLVLQHTPEETLGTIAEVLSAGGHGWRYIRPFANEPVPATLDVAGLVVLGGPMGAYETRRFGFLTDELALIASALDQQKPILGVCLGSQLLASALGARVYQGPAKEIGWYRVQIHADMHRDRLFGSLGRTFTAFHWHGDTFDIPKGACELGHSAITLHQGFRYATNAYGLQFHLEVTDQIINDLVASFGHELAEAHTDRDTLLAGKAEHLTEMQTLGREVYTAWAKML
jgi:GMP synthase-like glutamine amidotransferase